MGSDLVTGQTFYYDEAAAAHAVGFIEDCCVHVKGDLAGAPFLLLPWERTVVSDLFGWKRSHDDTRRYRIAYVSLPRKNGKSSLGYCIALLLLAADGEPGAEVYSAAYDKEQARIVFAAASTCVSRSPELAEIEVYKTALVYEDSSYKALSRESLSKHGYNAHGIIFDELHTQKTRELWDVLLTSTGSRAQPLLLAITTAGYDGESICAEQYAYAKQVRDGVVDDSSFYSLIFEAAPEDDWRDPEVWAKANPSLGVAVTQSYLEQECRRAESVPAYQNTFRRLHLNQWTTQDERAIDLALWDEGAAEVPLEELAATREPCYAGLDLANTRDLAAFVLVWPTSGGAFYTWPWCWVPSEWREQQLRRQLPYDAWVRDGQITETPGDVIDYDVIFSTIVELCARFNVVEIGFDRWRAAYLERVLGDRLDSTTLVGVGQGYATMNAPTADLLALLKQRRLTHGGHPVARWSANNLQLELDAAGNMKPSKARSKAKIDPTVALIMGLDRALRLGGQGESVYQERGLLTV